MTAALRAPGARRALLSRCHLPLFRSPRTLLALSSHSARTLLALCPQHLDKQGEEDKKAKRKKEYDKKKAKKKEEWTAHLRSQTGIEGFAALYKALRLVVTRSERLILQMCNTK